MADGRDDRRTREAIRFGGITFGGGSGRPVPGQREQDRYQGNRDASFEAPYEGGGYDPRERRRPGRTPPPAPATPDPVAPSLPPGTTAPPPVVPVTPPAPSNPGQGITPGGDVIQLIPTPNPDLSRGPALGTARNPLWSPGPQTNFFGDPSRYAPKKPAPAPARPPKFTSAKPPPQPLSLYGLLGGVLRQGFAALAYSSYLNLGERERQDARIDAASKSRRERAEQWLQPQVASVARLPLPAPARRQQRVEPVTTTPTRIAPALAPGPLGGGPKPAARTPSPKLRGTAPSATRSRQASPVSISVSLDLDTTPQTWLRTVRLPSIRLTPRTPNVPIIPTLPSIPGIPGIGTVPIPGIPGIEGNVGMMPQAGTSTSGGNCVCAPTKTKPKDKKKRRRRTREICYRGTFIERGDRVNKTRREVVPCDGDARTTKFRKRSKA